jgi:uncharacterized membrane protein
MPWRQQSNFRPPEKASTVERVVAVLCYLTAGLAGIIYIIISRSSYQAPFFRFHFLQSVIIGILALLLSWAQGAFSVIAAGPFNMFFGWLNSMMPNTGGMIANGILWTVGIIFTALSLLPIYGAIMAALGKYAEIPFISKVVRQQM